MLKARTDTPPKNYRPCAGIVLINPMGLIFVGERQGADGDNWQMPQGGIDEGEAPIDAAMRELFEETGVNQIEFLAESTDWKCYIVPEKRRPRHWQGRYIGQCQRWFAFRFTGQDDTVNLNLHEPEFSLWRWASADDVIKTAVSFKRQVYESVLNEFRPFLT
ncbi:MAG: RNA pyrophosphohydrolase [Geminicoccales bacterium]